MKRSLQNIAFVLFAIFSFPLVYQPFHIAVHHSYTHCRHCSVSCKQPHSDSQTINFETTQEKEEPCPICNYHFPLNEIPSGAVSQHNGEIKTGMVICDLQKVYIRVPDSNIKSRAPPAA